MIALTIIIISHVDANNNNGNDKLDVIAMVKMHHSHENDDSNFDDVMKLASVRVNDLNQASYFWNIAEIPEGTYYIKATSESSASVYAFSSAFTISM